MHVRVRLHGALHEHAGGQPVLDVELSDGAHLGALLDRLASAVPAVERRIRDEAGAVRAHVNLFVDARQLRGPGLLEHPLHDGAEVLVLPAVSGG